MGHIGKFDQDLDASFWDDISVWDRVRSLAPSADPVRGRLFQRPSASKSEAPMPVPASTPVRDMLAFGNDSAALAEEQPAVDWTRMEQAQPAQGDADTSLIINEDDDPVVQSIDLLRSRLMPVLQKNNWRKVAIVSPERGAGSSFIASNLAVRLARIASVRTVLMDMNLRQPQVADMFGLETDIDGSDVLTGVTPMEEGLVRYGRNLLLGVSDQSASSSVETLSDPRMRRTLESIEHALRPDIMLFDMPPMLTYPDMTAFQPYVDAVLLVADATRTKSAQIAECERAIAGQANLLGVVLNKARTKKRKSWLGRA